MFKIIKKLLKIEEVSNIKIQDRFLNHPPNPIKMFGKRYCYHAVGKFSSKIVLNENNILLDGYTTYLLAKEVGKKYVKVERVK